MRQAIIYGNIVTMDDRRPYARAALVKDGTIAFIGDAEVARELAGEGCEVLDYGDNYVYPGFLEAHCHPYMAGERAIGQADLAQVGLTPDYARYREIIRAFIAANPGQEVYVAAGWSEGEEYVTKAYLDDVCADKPVIMNTGGGHSMLLNTRALEWAGIDAAYAREYGPDMVHVDEAGEPDGYVCEKPVMEIMHKIPGTVEGAKRYLLAWQDMAFRNGFTAVADAGTELNFKDCMEAYHELEEEGRLKLRTHGYVLLDDNLKDPRAAVARVARDRARYSGEYFRVIGVKCFLDGVIEAHTGWQLEDYRDKPGYHGVERYNDHDSMVALLCAADAEGLAVHVHSIGTGAAHFMVGCIEDAEQATGDMDQRNVLAHLQYVDDEDIRRLGATRSVTAVPPLWTHKAGEGYDIEVAYVGREQAERGYPIKSFYDAGATVVFHSDYPVSPVINAIYSVLMAQTRAMPGDNTLKTQRGPEESIGRRQALAALTTNVARQWHQEDRMGSIEFGKLANMTVVDCDLIHDGLDKVAGSKVVATIVDGEEVYRA